MEAVNLALPHTIVHLEAGRHLYGGALQVKYLLEGLQGFPLRNILVCPKGADIADACRASLGNNIKIIECEMKGDLDWRLSSKVQHILHAESAHLLHIHSRRGADLWGARGASKACIPTILTRRVDNSEPRWLAHWKYHCLYDRVVTISEGVRQALVNNGVSPQKLQTIHSVVDTQLFKPGRNRKWFEETFSYSPKDEVIAIVAQLIERKGHRVLFEALGPLFKAHPHLQLMVLGKGPLRTQLQEAVNKNDLQHRIRFFGFREDIHKILPNLSLVVHPALAEGMGVSLLQASACGVPVIASKVGGIPEAIADGSHGILVEPGDSIQLREAIEKLLVNPALRKSFGENSRQRMLDEFSLPSMSEKYFSLYQNLI